jgi:hypothetical protein
MFVNSDCLDPSAERGATRTPSWEMSVRTAQGTWSNANIFITAGGGGGIMPNQPAWDIELFRENNVPRNWAIAFVDAYSGAILGATYCDDPCDR